jgi:hypothetical protein
VSGVGALFRGRHPTLYVAVSVKNPAADKPPAKRVRVARRCPFADALSGPASGPRADPAGVARLTHVLPGCFQAFPSLPTGKWSPGRSGSRVTPQPDFYLASALAPRQKRAGQRNIASRAGRWAELPDLAVARGPKMAITLLLWRYPR